MITKKQAASPLLIIVMGVSGTGKSTLAKYLSNDLNFEFVEADDFHTIQAKTMMSNSVSLTPAIRQEWVERLCGHLVNLALEGKSVVLAYSGLKAGHRQQFRQLGFYQRFLMLVANNEAIKNRIESRAGHFIQADFLQNQLVDMEYPSTEESDIEVIDANDDFATIAKRASALCVAHEIRAEMTK